MKVTTTIAVLIGIVAVTLLWASSGNSEYETLEKKEAIAEVDSENITVITYNMGYASGLFNIDPNTKNETEEEKADEKFFKENLETLIKKVNEQNPSLLFLQEVDFKSSRSYNTQQAEYLFNNIDTITHRYDITNWNKNFVPYPPLEPKRWQGALHAGQSILSAYPIIDYRKITLEKRKQNILYDQFYFERAIQVAIVKVKETNIAVLNVHLEAHDKELNKRHMQEVLEITKRYKEMDMPIILGGDFNQRIEKESEGYEEITTLGLKSVSETPLLTYPSNAPEHALDYLFYTPQTLRLLRYKRLDEFGQIADHLPITASFALKE